MEKLAQDFPDMTKSMIGDILTQCDGVSAEAQAMLTQLSTSATEEQRKETERKISELLESFPSLGKEAIAKCLKEHDDDLESCIVPLFSLQQKQQEEEQKQQQEQNRQKRQEEKQRMEQDARQQAQIFLKETFVSLNEGSILKILDENEGDIDATTEQLLANILAKEKSEKEKDASVQRKAAEEEARARNLKMERELKIDTLRARFGDNVSDQEVIDSLEESKWKVAPASQKLLAITEQRVKNQLQRVYLGFTEAQIEAVLDANNWNAAEAAKALANKAEIQSAGPEEAKKNFVLRSILLGKEMEDEVNEGPAEVDDRQILKEEIEAQIRADDSGPPGCPENKPESTTKEAPVAEEPKPQEAKGDADSPVLKEGEIDVVEEQRLKLELGPAVCGSGEKLLVTWEVQDESLILNSSTWIGLYKVGAADTAYSTYNWTNSSDPKGELRFYAPSSVGRYNVRFFSKESTGMFSSKHVRLAVSNSIHVGPEFEIETSVEANEEGSFVKVQAHQLSGEPCPNAWVGMYSSEDSADSAYISYDWVSTESLQFSVPKVGVWHFRLFPYRSYNSVASTKTEVTGSDSLVLSHQIAINKVTIACDINTVDPNLEHVWVGLFRVDEKDNKQWRRYKYIVKRGKTEVVFKAPVHPGTYHARLFANKTYTSVHCKSNEITLGHFPRT